MQKRLLQFVLLLLALVLLLSGCSGKSAESAESAASSESEASAVSEAQKEETKKPELSADVAAALQKLAQGKYGDYVTFGTFEQDGDETNGKEPIEWMILTKAPGRALVLSRYVLARMPFEDDANVNSATYPDSTVRKWLGGDFYEEAFTSEEKKLIYKTKLLTTYVEDYEKHTVFSQDSVFLLSYDEVNKYVASAPGSLQIAAPSEAVKATGVYVWENSDKENPTPGVGWMLRDSADSTYRCAGVDGGGYVSRDYGDDINDRGGVRPAMWIVYNEDETLAYDREGTVPEDEALNAQLASLKVGDKVEMGLFDATSRMYGNVHPIIWTVLKIQDGKALLFADGIINYLPLNDNREEKTCNWEMSTLRKYLNSDEFLDWTFTPAQRTKIALTSVHTGDDTAWQRSGGPDTQDYVFLPSKEEIAEYFPQKEDAALAEENYWLRSPDFVEDYMAFVYAGSGGIGSNNAYAYSGIRPMMWVEVS